MVGNAWEASTNRSRPLYHRATTRQYLFKLLLRKDFKFRRFAFFARCDSLPECKKLADRHPGKYDRFAYRPFSLRSDTAFGHLVAVYRTKSKNREWTILATIGEKNVFLRFFDDMHADFNEDTLKNLLSSFHVDHTNLDNDALIWVNFYDAAILDTSPYANV